MPENMQSPCFKEATQACVQSFCPSPFMDLPVPLNKPSGTLATCKRNFVASTSSLFLPNTQFTNHESLPSLYESFTRFKKAFPQYSETTRVDLIRAQEYNHLFQSSHICLDYIGIGLFSHSQSSPHGSSSSPVSSQCSDIPFFSTMYKSVNLKSELLHGGQGSELEYAIKKRIMDFLNISESDYCMVFTTNRSSAFKLVAESYPFRSSRKLLTVYDCESEAVEGMIKTSEKRGARVMLSEFKWPRFRIHSEKLRKMLARKKKKKKHRGLFVFPLQSRMTGASYSFQWMTTAQENGWHVLFDACALGPKDMNSFGLSLFRPDFLVCSFYKVFGENPTGFGCLLVKKSTVTILEDSTATGIVNIVSENKLFGFREETSELEESESPTSSVQEKKAKLGENGSLEIKCRGLDHVDSLGLVQISNRVRCLINWLINALVKLQHPYTENKICLVRIYGPKVKFDRGPALAFNVYDWKGEKVEPVLVQKLADRSNISLSNGVLHQMWFSEKYEEEKERVLERRHEDKERNGNKKKAYQGITVVTAALGFLTNFEDIYRLWAFIAQFLDADFVEKERWRYTALISSTTDISMILNISNDSFGDLHCTNPLIIEVQEITSFRELHEELFCLP